MYNELQKHLMDVDNQANERFELLMIDYAIANAEDYEQFLQILKDLDYVVTDKNDTLSIRREPYKSSWKKKNKNLKKNLEKEKSTNKINYQSLNKDS